MKLPRTEPKKARIEIIPMIDAIFFLLVFFMMTSLSMVQLDSQKVSLPASKAPQVKLEGEKVVMTIARDGQLFINQNPVQESQIVPELSKRVHDQPRITVIMNCDRDQEIGQFTRVFDLVKQANPASVMLAATPAEITQVPTQSH